MKKFLIIATIVAMGLATGQEARADFPPKTNAPISATYPHLTHDRAFWTHPIWNLPILPMNRRADALYRMPTLPIYMAAPWYQYFPYDAHFQTAAPMPGINQAYYPGNPFIGPMNAPFTSPPIVPGYGQGYGVPNYGTPAPAPVAPLPNPKP
ncbi:MAG: hypothetical protein N2112_14405 [Gemmataceae bacterium]|jgi:hypothetical protein|nr:hypothetical protein [Gemmataceae bacterium]